MKRSEMIRYIEGLLQSSDGLQVTYRNRSEYILTQLERMGMRPPVKSGPGTDLTAAVETIRAAIDSSWDKELLNVIK